MLEGKLRFFIDQAASHDEVTGNPLGALGFQRLDLVLGGAVKFLARDILIDLRGTFAVGTVGAAQVTRIGNTGRTVLSTVPSELAGTGVTAVETAGCPVLAVAERLAVVAAGEPATFAVTFAARTITIRLVITVAVRLPLTTTTERLTLSPAAAEAAAIAFTFTARTITIRLIIAVAIGLPLTEGLAVTGA
jgi:hypothetical protein